MTYVGFRYLSKADAAAVLYDRPAGAREVDIDILAVMHSKLSTSDHENTPLGIGDVCWPTHSAAEQQTLSNSFHREPGEGCSVGAWY